MDARVREVLLACRNLLAEAVEHGAATKYGERLLADLDRVLEEGSRPESQASGVPTRGMILELAQRDVHLNQALGLWRQGGLSWEAALHVAARALVEAKRELAEKLTSVLNLAPWRGAAPEVEGGGG
jgi:hypothetical protein